MSAFEFLPTTIAGLTLIERQPREDHRGFLARVYSADEFVAAGMAKAIAQINHTMTRRRGAVRGMHFQWPPYAEMKLVTCVRGEVFDVAIDLRRHSPTFLRWHAEQLSAASHRSLLIPEGFAHGFQALTDDCELLYLHTAPFERTAEGALNATDPAVGIDWPMAIVEISDRDRSHPFVSADFQGFNL